MDVRDRDHPAERVVPPPLATPLPLGFLALALAAAGHPVLPVLRRGGDDV